MSFDKYRSDYINRLNDIKLSFDELDAHAAIDNYSIPRSRLLFITLVRFLSVLSGERWTYRSNPEIFGILRNDLKIDIPISNIEHENSSLFRNKKLQEQWVTWTVLCDCISIDRLILYPQWDFNQKDQTKVMPLSTAVFRLFACAGMLFLNQLDYESVDAMSKTDAMLQKIFELVASEKKTAAFVFTHHIKIESKTLLPEITITKTGITE